MGLVAIAVATLANFFLGALWYSPVMFGSIWLRHAFPDRKPEGSAIIFILSLIGHASAVTFVSYIFSSVAEVKTVEAAINMALLLSGLVASIEIPHAAFGGKSVPWYLIDKGYDVALLVLASVILVLLA